MSSNNIPLTPDRMRSERWYAVFCNSSREVQAAAELHRRIDLTIYLPQIQRQIGRQIHYEPLFPRYLFARADLERGILHAINTTPGVTRLVAFGDLPPPIPDDLIDALRRRVDELNLSGGMPPHTFQNGEMVRVRGGPLRGLEAIFLGQLHGAERVRVLIDFLGSLREADLDVRLLERANGSPHPHVRRSRGKGRPIR